MLKFKQFLSEGKKDWAFNYTSLRDPTSFFQNISSEQGIEQNAALDQYTRSSFGINPHLRDTPEKFPALFHSHVQELDNLFKTSHSINEKPMTVYRSLVEVEPEKWEEVVRHASEGKHLVDPGFMSTTVNRDFAAKHVSPIGKVLKIQVPPNSKFLVNSQTTKNFAGEDEIIFPRGTKLELDPNFEKVRIHPYSEGSKTYGRFKVRPHEVEVYKARIVPAEASTPSVEWPSLKISEKTLKALTLPKEALSLAAPVETATEKVVGKVLGTAAGSVAGMWGLADTLFGQQAQAAPIVTPADIEMRQKGNIRQVGELLGRGYNPSGKRSKERTE